MFKRKATVPHEVKGRLENIVEEGTGTTVWAFRKESRAGCYGVARPLKNGDHLRVFNDYARKQEIWSGDIDLDFKTGRKPLPRAPHITAQFVKGVGEVHGVQRDEDPEKWGEMFTSGKYASFIPRSPNTP